jgi:hypothetical protein
LMVALPLGLVFPASGAHVVIASVGDEEKRVAFHVRVPPAAR